MTCSLSLTFRPSTSTSTGQAHGGSSYFLTLTHSTLPSFSHTTHVLTASTPHRVCVPNSPAEPRTTYLLIQCHDARQPHNTPPSPHLRVPLPSPSPEHSASAQTLNFSNGVSVHMTLDMSETVTIGQPSPSPTPSPTSPRNVRLQVGNHGIIHAWRLYPARIPGCTTVISRRRTDGTWAPLHDMAQPTWLKQSSWISLTSSRPHRTVLQLDAYTTSEADKRQRHVATVRFALSACLHPSQRTTILPLFQPACRGSHRGARTATTATTATNSAPPRAAAHSGYVLARRDDTTDVVLDCLVYGRKGVRQGRGPIVSERGAFAPACCEPWMGRCSADDWIERTSLLWSGVQLAFWKVVSAVSVTSRKEKMERSCAFSKVGDIEWG